MSFSPLPCIFMGLIFTSRWIECTVKHGSASWSHVLMRKVFYTHIRLRWFIVPGIIKLNSFRKLPKFQSTISLKQCTSPFKKRDQCIEKHGHSAPCVSCSPAPGSAAVQRLGAPRNANLWQVVVTVNRRGPHFCDIWNPWFGKCSHIVMSLD